MRKKTDRRGGKKRAGTTLVVLDLLLAITEMRGKEFSTTDVVKRTDLWYGSVYRHLRLLEREGWIEGWLDTRKHPKRGTYRWRALRGVVNIRPKRLLNLKEADGKVVGGRRRR